MSKTCQNDFTQTFMFTIDSHPEGVLTKINFRDIDPLTINVVFVDVITANRNTFFFSGLNSRRWEKHHEILIR